MTWGELKAILDGRLPDGDETKLDYIDMDFFDDLADEITVDFYAGAAAITTPLFPAE